MERFDAVLTEALRDPTRRLYLMTTIRSDFVGRFDRLKGLGALLNTEAETGRYLLKSMSEVGLREAIERPAASIGLEWEAGLVDRIVEDASAMEGGLPLVAHVLRALWAERKGRTLGYEAYEALGRVSGALTRSADAMVDALGEDGRDRARPMLLKLVKIGRGTEDGRRAAPRREVVEAGGGGEAGERTLLGLSGGASTEGQGGKLRLLVVGDEEGAELVELVHEALVRRWKTLGEWIEQSRKALELTDDLEAAALSWEAGGRLEDGLPGAGQLAYFKRAEAPSAKAIGFLHEAEARERRRVRRARAVGVGAGVVAVGMAALAGFAAVQRSEAVVQGNLAREQTSLAETRLVQALEVANEVTYSIDRELAPIGGTAEIRRKLLERAGNLQDKLMEGGGDTKAALYGRMVTHIQKGNLAMYHDNSANARVEYVEALSIAIKLSVSDPADARFTGGLARCHCKLADAVRAEGDLAKARTEYETSLALFQALAQSDSTDKDHKQNMVVCYERLGDLARMQGNLDEARKDYEKGLELTKALHESEPMNAEFRQALSIGNEILGDLALERRDLPRAHEAYDRSTELRQALVRSDPTNAELGRALAVGYTKLGQVALAETNLNAARENYEKGLELVQVLVRSDPTNAELGRALAVIHEKLGDLDLESRNLDQARKHYEMSLNICLLLAELDSDERGVQARPVNGVLQARRPPAAPAPTRQGAGNLREEPGASPGARAVGPDERTMAARRHQQPREACSAPGSSRGHPRLPRPRDQGPHGPRSLRQGGQREGRPQRLQHPCMGASDGSATPLIEPAPPSSVLPPRAATRTAMTGRAAGCASLYPSPHAPHRPCSRRARRSLRRPEPHPFRWRRPLGGRRSPVVEAPRRPPRRPRPRPPGPSCRA